MISNKDSVKMFYSFAVKDSEKYDLYNISARTAVDAVIFISKELKTYDPYFTVNFTTEV